ncbi:MAG: hypothetical protein R3A48_27040 [Polyangiales bacterium]
MRRIPLTLIAVAAFSTPALAQAQSDAPVTRGPIPMLNETARVVDVVDAFDRGSNWSFRLTAGYSYQSRRATVLRERRVSEAVAGMGLVQRIPVANYRESTHTLMVNAELALYRDLAFTFGLPFVLSNTRSLSVASGATGTEIQNALYDGWTERGAPTSILSLPFESPERSGIDQLRLGVQWSIFNQQRDRTKPTWMIAFEWRPPVGSQLRACQVVSGRTVCPQVSSVPSLPANGGIASTDAATRAPATGDDANPGISRGMHGVYFQTLLSRRVGYVEPYAGLDFLAEFPVRSSPFRYLDSPYGMLATFPPITTTLMAGLEIIPWENRETWQRAIIDLRVRGTYRSPGRDFSVLYDALGSSNSRPLLAPGCPSNVRNADGTCQPGREVYFDGLTGTASHIMLGANMNISIQPAKFLRFTLGGAFTWVSTHSITNTDACNPGTSPPADHPEWRGGCVSNSAPDPAHRAVIDQPGGRFYSSDELLFDIFASISLTPRVW